MNATELYVYQSIGAGSVTILIVIAVLIIGYGFYRRIKLSQKGW